MNENDFRKEYERMQHQVRASSDLKERTLAAAERAADRFASSAQPVATASAKRHTGAPDRAAAASQLRVAGVCPPQPASSPRPSSPAACPWPWARWTRTAIRPSP